MNIQNTKFKKHDKVVLARFLGETTPPCDVVDAENYWKLIGNIGVIVSEKGKHHPAFPERGERVLVCFEDVDILKINLSCHNEPPNSLWIFTTDLEFA